MRGTVERYRPEIPRARTGLMVREFETVKLFQKNTEGSSLLVLERFSAKRPALLSECVFAFAYVFACSGAVPYQL